MYDLQRHQLIVFRPNSAYEEQRGIAPVYHFGVYSRSLKKPEHIGGRGRGVSPLYSRKLHILVRRARTSCVTSLTIFVFALGGMVVNHFASLTFPI
jgi:hypothetical protein